MQFFLYKPNQNDIPVSTLKLDFHGVFLQYQAQNFLQGDGYSNITLGIVKAKILEIAKYPVSASTPNIKKKVRLGIRFGSACGTGFYNDYPYVEFVGKAHQPDAEPVYQKYPVFFEQQYLDKIKDFLQWLADGLEPVMEHIESITVCGINKDTYELRVIDWDWTVAVLEEYAYRDGAQKWLEAGYTVNKCISACRQLIQLYATYFPDTKKVVRLIGGLTGFPTIDQNGVCLPKKQPDINMSVIDECKKHPLMALELTALTGTGGTQSSIVNAGIEMDFQLNFQTYGKATTAAEFEKAIVNGKDHHATQIEVYENNIKNYQSIIKKYSTW